MSTHKKNTNKFLHCCQWRVLTRVRAEDQKSVMLLGPQLGNQEWGTLKASLPRTNKQGFKAVLQSYGIMSPCCQTQNAPDNEGDDFIQPITKGEC